MAIVRWEAARAAARIDPLEVDALDGHLLVLDGVTADDDVDLAWVRRAPCVVIGIAPAGRTASAVVDVAVDGGADLDALGRRVEANPQASRLLVEVLRAIPDLDVVAGLALESLAYSTLLAGPEFSRWLDGRTPKAPPAFAGPPVRVERDGARLLLTLARPENRNAFSAAVRDALFEGLAIPVLDATVEVVALAGDGPVFSSGGDLTEFGTTSDPVRAHEVRTQRSVGAAIAACPARTEVRVHGACVGAGVELPAFADRVVADAGTTFRLPEVAMGLIPGAGGTVSCTRRIGRQATARLALLGEPIEAATALRLGLVDEVA